jgi:hypothetical protein
MTGELVERSDNNVPCFEREFHQKPLTNLADGCVFFGNVETELVGECGAPVVDRCRYFVGVKQAGISHEKFRPTGSLRHSKLEKNDIKAKTKYEACAHDIEAGMSYINGHLTSNV